MDNFEKFYNRALNSLSFRPRSEKELRDYLEKKKCDDLSIQRIIENLKEHKFLNDEEFVAWWIEQRTIVKPKAARIIKFELKQKGISKELIEEAFEKDLSSDLEKAKALIKKRIKRYQGVADKKKIYEKLGRFLASKGFDYEIIKEVLDQVFTKEYNK